MEEMITRILEGGGPPTLFTKDWDVEMQPYAREEIFDRILDTFQKHLEVSDPGGFKNLELLVSVIEDDIHYGCESQWYYLWNISRAMFMVENKSQNTMPNQELPAVDIVDWRTHLQPDFRQQILNKMMDPIKKHVPSMLQKMKQSGERFEEKTYNECKSEWEYILTISSSMIYIGGKLENPLFIRLPALPRYANGRDLHEEVYQKIKFLNDDDIDEAADMFVEVFTSI